MRIWLAPSAFFPHRGGVEELTLKLAQTLQAQAHEVRVIAPRHPPELPGAEVVDGVDVIRLDYRAPRRSARDVVAFLVSVRRLPRLLADLPAPDLLHVICPSVQLDPLARWARRNGVPFVLTTQGETVMDANDLYGRSAWMRYVLRRESERAQALTACSTWTAEQAQVLAPAFARARVVLNGVDPDDWTVPPPPDEPVVAAWGRHVPQKGLDLLIAAFPLVRQVLPSARLLVGGDGPEHERLKAMAGDGVEFLGSLDRQGVRDLLARARVAVAPSRLEPFGIVAVEALAAGRRLVYSSHGGLAEAAGPCGEGVVPEDASALARAVVSALSAPGDEGRGRARAHQLSWSSIALEYLDVYREALAR